VKAVAEDDERRQSPWTTTDAKRTYAAGVLWAVGLIVTFFVEDRLTPGSWFRVRTDAAGLLFLASALVGGSNFFPKGVRAVRSLALDMNFLMTAAIAGAVLIGEPLEAAAIAFLFSVAELLERHAVVRARSSIDQLLRLAPETASLVEADGTEGVVATSELRKGQRVRVRPGEKVPIDGVVRDGHSAVNQANVTGESVPVAKTPGDSVYASTLNTDGFLEVEATTDAGDTTLDRIARLVRAAQSGRSPTEQFVKVFARYYTPAVTGLAVVVMVVPPLLGLGTGLTWFVRGLTLLVIACPCALVIATPVTIVSALTSAARHGVLIKGGEYVEALGGICAMAFDKTGTLTLGQLEVTDVVPVYGTSASELLSLSAALERRSEHPIAQAIVEHATETLGISPAESLRDFRAHPGLGVSAHVSAARVVVGTVELHRANGSSTLDEDLATRYDHLERAGRTVVLASRDGRIIGLIALADTLRPEAHAVLARLREAGVHHQVILTGDQSYAADAVGAAVGADEVLAELKP